MSSASCRFRSTFRCPGRFTASPSRQLRAIGVNGTQLLTHAEHWLKARGVRVLQIKTVSASSPSTHYAQTRQFYASRGYFPVEEFPLLWSPRNPALQLIKVLSEA